ncbi:MAG: hypothetical protein ACYTDT_02630 [Planctomycetota bacterium]
MALAFYIEYPRISVVDVGGSAKKPRIKNVIVGDLPDARNDDGSPVADKQAWLNEQITAFCKENKLAGKAYLLVGPEGMRYRDMQIAFTERSKIDRVLQYEVEALIPSTPIEELALGYEILYSDENGSKLLVQAAEREYVKERLIALEEAGLAIKAVDSHLSGTLNLGLMHFELAAGTGNSLWIDFAGTTATVSLVEDGEIRSSRVFMSPYLAGATGVTAQATDVKDQARELAKEAKDHANAWAGTESESLPGNDSVSGLPKSESVNIGADEVADRIEHMSQDQLQNFVTRVAVEARRTLYSNNLTEEPTRLVVSGLGIAGDSLVSQIGNELAIDDARSVNLMETVNPASKDAKPKVQTPDIGELSYLTGTAMKGVGRDYSGIDFRTGSLAAGTTFDYARTPLAFTATLALLFGGIMFLISFTNVNRLEKDIARLVQKSEKTPDYETPRDAFDKAYVQHWKKSAKEKEKAAYDAVQKSKKERSKKEQMDMKYTALPDDPAQEIINTYSKLERQIKRLMGGNQESDYPFPFPRDEILKLALQTIEKGGPSYDFALMEIDVSKSNLTVKMYVSDNEPPEEKAKHKNIDEDNRMITAFRNMVMDQQKLGATDLKKNWFEGSLTPTRGNKNANGAEGRKARLLTIKIPLNKDPKFQKKKKTTKKKTT